MARDVSDTTPIHSKQDLVDWIAAGEKPVEAWRVGTEHEKIPFYKADFTPVPYQGDNGIGALLAGMAKLTGWDPIIEHGNAIGLFDEHGGGAVSLEPGGQFELSGAPLADIHETVRELDIHLQQSKVIGDALGMGFLSIGASPKWSREQTPVMPKGRYGIMTRYMPKVGSLGLDMMYRTSTVQANLDYCSEQDMVAKLRTSIALQPIVTALFANSPFLDGKPNGFLSMRSEIWRDTDADRSGMTPFVFEDGFGYERYVDWICDVPMYFVKRGETYHDVAGASFHDLLAGKLPQLPGEMPTLSDWANHVSTVFPEVRLKRYLEMRGADVGPPERIAALSALWVGLLFDSVSQDSAWQLVRNWSDDERQKLRDDVPRQALNATVAGRSVRDIAMDMLAIAKDGLRRRNRLDASGADETKYLDPLFEIADSGITSAERLLELYRGEWCESVDPVFTTCIF